MKTKFSASFLYLGWGPQMSLTVYITLFFITQLLRGIFEIFCNINFQDLNMRYVSFKAKNLMHFILTHLSSKTVLHFLKPSLIHTSNYYNNQCIHPWYTPQTGHSDCFMFFYLRNEILDKSTVRWEIRAGFNTIKKGYSRTFCVCIKFQRFCDPLVYDRLI